MFGWISRRKHQREVVKFAEAYRWERDEAKREAEKAKADRNRLLDCLATGRLMDARAIDHTIGRKQIHVVLDVHPLLAQAPGGEMRALAERITMALCDFQKDYRPDMRDPHPERRMLRA